MRNIDQPFTVTEIKGNGDKVDIGFVNGFTTWPYSEGQLLVGPFSVQAKFTPRFALCDRGPAHRPSLSAPSIQEIEIIDFTCMLA